MAPTTTIATAATPEQQPVGVRVEHLAERGYLVEMAGDVAVHARR